MIHVSTDESGRFPRPGRHLSGGEASMKKSLFALAAGCLGLALSGAPFFTGAASAATIDYIFSGTANFTLNGVSFTDAPFTLTYVSDTSTITSGGGEFFNTGVGTFVSGATTATMTGDVNEVIVNPPSDFLGF